jgi:hypothetical protein
LSKKLSKKAELEELRRTRTLYFAAADWLLDMVTGRWTASDDCPCCVTDDKTGERKCSTFCAGLRIEYAQKIIEENPL